MEKVSYNFTRFVKCSHFFHIFPDSSEISPKTNLIILSKVIVLTNDDDDGRKTLP